MTDTIHLGMPFIEGSQAQKHVTHNEALRILDAVAQIGVLDRDQTSPPLSPADGDCYIVASGAAGAWAGHADAVAVWEDGAWRFLAPKLGWCAWCDADGALLVYDGAAWTEAASSGFLSGSVAQLGVNDTASSPNLLTVKSNAALFNAIAAAGGGSGDMRLQISKESSTNTASVVFADAFSGRAEFGLVGSDAFKLKVSSDGSAFVEALNIDQSSGNATLPRGLLLTGVISPAQITANQNDYAPTGLGTASILKLSSDAARSITGLAAGGEGCVVSLINTGSQTINLLDESASSSAANRFTLGGDVAIGAKQAILLRYDSTASRWYALARPAAASTGQLLSANNLSDLASATTARTNLGVRDVLTANRTYYVRTDGSNSNNGLANTSGGAFLTIQKAVDTVAALDISVYNVTIQLANGTYTGAVTVNAPWIGSGNVTIVGNTTTPANVIISTTSADCFTAFNGARFTVSGLELRTTTAGYGLNAQNFAIVTVGTSIRFGAVANGHMIAFGQGKIFGRSSYTIAGGAQFHWISNVGGIIDVAGITITLSGTPAFSQQFAHAEGMSYQSIGYSTFSGTATGTRYIAIGGAGIDTAGGGASYLPGSAAGSVTSPGWYS